MNLKKCLALILSASMALSGMVLPSVASAAGEYGTVTTNSDGSKTLTFGTDSITQSGGGSFGEDADNAGYSRPDNLKTDSTGAAVLTLPEIDLNGSGYDKIDLYAACQKDMAVTVKVGDTAVATFANVNNGQWHVYQTNTASLTTTEASGNVTLNITGAATTYCGNYVYVKFYNSSVPAATNPPSATTAPSATNPPSATTAPGTGDVLPYLDTSLSFEERAADLVSRMTLEEKVSQIGYKAAAIDRLGVKAYDYWKEALHGVARQGQATNFPAPLAMSNTWNRDLVYQLADITSTEARAKNNRYNLSYWSPTVNMARDPRWGRNEETMGEDPYLTGQLGAEFVKGMQGDDDTYLKTISTLKHFAANNNEQNRSSGSSLMTEFNFRNYYTKVFQNITEEVMPASIMSSYNATSITRNGEYIYNFVPSLANSYLLQDLLRRNWGFDGYVTSDCGAGEYVVGSATRNPNTAFELGILGNSTSPQEAYIAEFYKAGLNVECNLGGGNASTLYGVKAVQNGYLSEKELERAVYELFLQRFRTGEFDDTSAYRNITSAAIETDESVAVAEEVAEESWVLLKNDDNTLPLKNDVTKVAVVGNMANTLALGDYTGVPTKTVKPIEGIKTEVGKLGAEVSYLGEITDDEKLFNVKSVKLVKTDGSKITIDLSTAQSVTGMTLQDGKLVDVTPAASAVIQNVNFLDVVSVEVEMATGTRIGGSLNIAYGAGGPTVAAINTTSTSSLDTYVACTDEYTGADGGYNGVADMVISASATPPEFSVANYKTQLDAADVIIAYAGTIPKQDGFGTADSSESKDRSSINLPSHQAHVQAICDAYPDKTIVVMSTVGQINVEPFKDKCKAILWTSYNGQTQGTALGKVLTGEANPSGKLSTTWYANADISKMELYGATKTIDGISGAYTDYNIQADGTNPGHTYQYYSGTPVYPFGYGLSYTSFEYSNMTIDKTSVDANGAVTLTVDVKNTGAVAGKEAVQLYVAHPNAGTGTTPAKQLKGFDKVELAPNETKTVTFALDVKDMYLFDETAQKDIVPTGTYTAYIAKNANDTANSKTFDVTGTLVSTLKTVKAIPSGVSLNGLICEDGTGLSSVTEIDSNLSAIMSDEVWVDLDKANTSVGTAEQVETLSAEYPASISYQNGIVTITSSKEQSADLIHASYTGGKLSHVDITSVDLNTDAPVTVSKFDIADGDKLMLWNSAEGMVPLAEVLTAENTVSDDEITVVYTSSDTDVATVDANGVVTSGAKEGVATITATVTVNGITKTASYPVVNKLEIKPYPEEITAAKAELKAAYDKLPQAAYSAENLAELAKVYNDANAALEAVSTRTELSTTLAKAINDLNSVEMDNLAVGYSIESVNPEFIKAGVIDYREGGIPLYNGASGTITNANPYSPIALKVLDGDGNAVDNSNIIWKVQKFDDSVRKVADIDENGNLTVYGNGIIQITASNIEAMTCGKLMVHVNTQIEAEYADNGNGADLTDNQTGSSGSFDAGSTGDAWIEFKSVKLSNLDSIVARYAGKNAGTINISFDKSASSDKLIASASATATGAWNTWSDVNLALNAENLYNAQINGLLDEYGCATVYVQTNGTNLDYFRLNYIENNDEIPYIIEKTLNKTDGRVKATLKYRGSTLATTVKLVAEVLNADGETVKNTVSTDVKGTGEFEIATTAVDGETVRLTVRDADNNALSESVEKVYTTPVDSEIVVYSLNSTDYDYTPLTGGTDSVAYTDTINGLSGYGGWASVDKSGTYTYSDVNEKTYDYSFTKAWQAGAGSQTKRSLYFTPKAPCKVTAVFLGGEASRSMTVYQSADNTFTQPGTGSIAAASIEVTDTTKPVYVYGGSSNKQLFAIIVEYYGTAPQTASVESSSVLTDEAAIDRPVQFVDWGGSNVVLTKHDTTGETKVWIQAADGSRIQLDTDYFYEADVPYNYDDQYTINALAVYKDRLYAGCDGGLVIVFTNCEKCYKLKKACDIDIKQMSIIDGVMYASDGETDVEIDMNTIGGDSIEPDEARVLLAQGATLIDVRTEAEYAEKSVEGSVNIPIDTLEEGLGAYDKDAVLIFCCASGVRSARAVETAKQLGYTNVYNLGSIDNLL